MEKFLNAKENAKSRFESFNQKLQTAQQDLSTSWNKISDKAKKEAKNVNRKARKVLATEDGGELRESYVLKVNLDVGLDICKKYQNDWVDLHKDSVLNAQKAERIDDVMYGFAKQWQQWSTNLETFRDNLVALPDLVSKVEIAKSQLESMSYQLQRVEEQILEYEDADARSVMEEDKIVEKIKLSQLVESKHHEYTREKALRENEQALIESQQATAIEEVTHELERSKSVESVEKQQAYEDAFLDQMNQYIKYGKLEEPIAGSAGTQDENEAHLENLKIEDSDLDTLKEFLGPEELDSVLSTRAFSSSLANKSTATNASTPDSLSASDPSLPSSPDSTESVKTEVGDEPEDTVSSPPPSASGEKVSTKNATVDKSAIDTIDTTLPKSDELQESLAKNDNVFTSPDASSEEFSVIKPSEISDNEGDFFDAISDGEE